MDYVKGIGMMLLVGSLGWLSAYAIAFVLAWGIWSAQVLLGAVTLTVIVAGLLFWGFGSAVGYHLRGRL